MGKSYSVSLDTIVQEFKLTVVRRANDYENVRVSNCDVSRPGLPLGTHVSRASIPPGISFPVPYPL